MFTLSEIEQILPVEAIFVDDSVPLEALDLINTILNIRNKKFDEKFHAPILSGCRESQTNRDPRIRIQSKILFVAGKKYYFCAQLHKFYLFSSA